MNNRVLAAFVALVLALLFVSSVTAQNDDDDDDSGVAADDGQPGNNNVGAFDGQAFVSFSLANCE